LWLADHCFLSAGWAHQWFQSDYSMSGVRFLSPIFEPKGPLVKNHRQRSGLTPKEAAEYLGLRVGTIYKKARLRELPSVKVGGALRLDVAALDRYIQQHTIEPLE
jgi:excisionase family DNA binding protein